MATKRKAAALKASDLKPAPYNPRRISPDALAGLGQSVESFGDLSGIVWNKRSGFLVCGHQRIEALRQRGAEWKDGAFELNGERFPVRVVDWDETTERAANVTANNPHIAGDWTEDLSGILEGLSNSLDVFDDLLLGALDGENNFQKEQNTKGEVVFSEELGEANNYIVLVFRNEIDWVCAKTHFHLNTTYSKRMNGKPWAKGIGRVVDGAKYLQGATNE